MLQVAEVALNVQPFQHNAKAAAKASNPNRRRKWLIPLVLAAQVGRGLTPRPSKQPPRRGQFAAWALSWSALMLPPQRLQRRQPPTCPALPCSLPVHDTQVGLKLLLDRVMDEDGCRGDANGPFDEQTVRERREELKRDKVSRRLRGGLEPTATCHAAMYGVQNRQDNPLQAQPGAWRARHFSVNKGGHRCGVMWYWPGAPHPCSCLAFSPTPQEERRRKQERKKALATGATAPAAAFYDDYSEEEEDDDF